MQKEGASYGVSPAFFLSAYGESFGPAQVLDGLSRIRSLDPEARWPLVAYEPEVFDPDRMESWTTHSTREVAQRAADLGLSPRCFAAHYLGELLVRNPECGETIVAAEMPRCAALAHELGAGTVLIPVLSAGSEERHFLRSMELAVRFASNNALTVAIEQVPGRAASSVDDLLRHFEHVPGLRLWFDTGNAAAAGDDVPSAIREAREHIVGTHLCDCNDAGSSEAPGDGEIPWEGVMAGLQAVPSELTLDLEIRCPAYSIRDAYTAGYKRVAASISGVIQEVGL